MNDPGNAPRPRRRPPWWPESEPWPPDGRGAWRRGWASRGGTWSGHGGWEGAGPWRRGRAHFWRPFGCLILAMLLFGGGTLALGFWAIAALLGLVSTHPVVLALGLGVLLFIGAGTFLSTRGLRRMAEPLDDLVEAAGRVEAGDYSVRVAERGAGDVRSLARAFNQMSARLEEGDARRRSFLADVAHELRTSLTVIQGGLEAVIDGVYPPDVAHLSPLVDQAKALEGLVEDLRTVALAEAGSLALARESVDPGTLAEEAVAAFRGAAEAAGVALSVEVGPRLPRIEVDPARIRQVLSNLLGNALRHTPAGGSVAVSVRGEPESLTVEVRDTGSGIPPALLSSVFERFVKDPGSTGSGLGLAIAKDLVVAHGGTISATSTPGHGTTIRFDLPLRPAAS